MVKNTDLANALSEVIVKGMQEKKAKNIVKIDLSHVNEAAADYFVVCHGDSDRQVKSIADSVEEETLKALGEKPRRSEGHGENRWVLLDYTDVVVHVFQKDVRSFYEIEDLWHDGKFTNYEDIA